MGVKRRDIQLWEQADGGRGIRFASSQPAAKQWLRAFLYAVHGKHRAFLLPTGRPDLVAAGDASTGLLNVQGPPNAQAPNYVADWFESAAHRRIMIVLTTGVAHYRSISACLDNGDGTQQLTLSSALAGTIDHIQFLETVRMETDDIEIIVEDQKYVCELRAQVVQG